MKIIKNNIAKNLDELDDLIDKYNVVDYKDIEGLFEIFDNILSGYGLEVELFDNEDDNYIFRIIKK